MAKASEIAAQFPRLRARLQTAASGYSAAPGNTFEFGLQAILDGLQAQLTAAGQNARGQPATARNHSADLSWPHEERTTSPEPVPSPGQIRCLPPLVL